MQIRRRRRGPPAPVAQPAPAPLGTGDHVGQSRGGYRLVRLLGAGRRASVYLGHADAPPGREDASSVAVKIFHNSVPESEVDAEIEAVSRCVHPHSLRLLDVATGDDGRPCLILERLAGGSLSSLVSDRERIWPGEAVTILAPVFSAVEAMHDAGVAHGGLRLSSVLFRASGSPVVCGFGSAVLMPVGQSEAVRAGNPLVARDREDLVQLARGVLARVPGQAAADLAASLPAGQASADRHASADREASPDGVASPGGRAIDPARLFELAEPVPVRLGPVEIADEHGEGAGNRAVAVWAGTPERRGTERRAAERRAAEHTGVARTGAGHRAGGAARGHAAGVASWLVGQARQVRARFWVVGAAVAASVLAALVLVPQTDTATVGAVPGDPPGVATTEPPTEVATQPPAHGPSSSDDRVLSDDPVRSDDPVIPDNPVLSDDPVAALGALLAERERCVRDLSVLCLDGVLQAGSPAMERDTAVIRSIQDGAEVPPEAEIETEQLALVERLGDSALVGLGVAGPEEQGQSKSASTLVMRGEAGWRIRDYL